MPVTMQRYFERACLVTLLVRKLSLDDVGWILESLRKACRRLTTRRAPTDFPGTLPGRSNHAVRRATKATTFCSALFAFEQYFAHASISFRRFSKRSPRR